MIVSLSSFPFIDPLTSITFCLTPAISCSLAIRVEDLLRSVLNNRYPQRIEIPKVPNLSASLWYALDLLNALDLEARVGAKVSLDEQRNEDGPLRVRVDTAAGAACEGRVEERCAGGGLVSLYRGKLSERNEERSGE